MSATDLDWTKPAALAIPKEGYFEEERGRYGPVFPRTPACYGFTIIAKVIPGREEAIREHGRTIQAAVEKRSRGSGSAEAALSAVAAVQSRRRPVFPVPGHLRHRLRQVHRGCGDAIRPVGHRNHL